MKVLFTILRIRESITDGGMYEDLIMEFVKNGHEVTVIGGSQNKTRMYDDSGVRIISVKSMRNPPYERKVISI